MIGSKSEKKVHCDKQQRGREELRLDWALLCCPSVVRQLSDCLLSGRHRLCFILAADSDVASTLLLTCCLNNRIKAKEGSNRLRMPHYHHMSTGVWCRIPVCVGVSGVLLWCLDDAGVSQHLLFLLTWGVTSWLGDLDLYTRLTWAVQAALGPSANASNPIVKNISTPLLDFCADKVASMCVRAAGSRSYHP